MQDTIIKEEILKNIVEHQLIADQDTIVVAVSGGPDSMCLLQVLYDLQDILCDKYHIHYTMVVAHVNHMIREESKQEKVYVENFCKAKEIPFYYLEKDVPRLSKVYKMSEETYGRKIRYDFFDEVASKCQAQKIAVAHHLDDNVETIFLNIIRGCGLQGLTGMDFRYKNIIRPLLTIEKKDILEYNIIQNLNPCFDKTNELDIYIRNKVRNKLIPSLKEEYNASILKNMTRMRNILAIDNDFLKEYTNQVVEKAIIEKEEKDQTLRSMTFDFSNIMQEHLAIRTRAIRKMIEMKMITLEGIENIHVMDILKLLENNKVKKKYIIGNKFTIEIIKKNVAKIY